MAGNNGWAVWIAALVNLPATIAALAAAYGVWRANKKVTDVHADVVGTKEHVEKLESQTNGIKDALVKATSKIAREEGVVQEKARQEEKEKQKAEGAREEKARQDEKK